MASGSRIEIEFWCSTSSSDAIESSSVVSAFIVPRASRCDSSRRCLSSTFFSSATRARSGSSGCLSSRCSARDLLLDARAGLPRQHALVALQRQHAVQAAVQDHVELAPLLREVGLRDAVQALIVRLDELAQMLHGVVAPLVRRIQRVERTGAVGIGLLPRARAAPSVHQAPQRPRNPGWAAVRARRPAIPAAAADSCSRSRDGDHSAQHDRLVLIEHQLLQDRAVSILILARRRHSLGRLADVTVNRGADSLRGRDSMSRVRHESSPVNRAGSVPASPLPSRERARERGKSGAVSPSPPPSPIEGEGVSFCNHRGGSWVGGEGY